MLTATTDTIVLPQVDNIDPAVEAEVMQSIKEEDENGGPKAYYTINQVRQKIGEKFGFNI